jgi:hypothetical protein
MSSDRELVLKPRRDRIRDLVWTRVSTYAQETPSFRAAVEPIGIFSFMRVVDSVADSVIAEHDERDSLHRITDELAARVRALEAENARLKKIIDAAAAVLSSPDSPVGGTQ